MNPPQRGPARSGHRGCVEGSGERRPRSPQGWVPVLGALNLDVATAAFTPRCSFCARCSLQSPARVAAMRASTRCRSASVTPSACTTRAAAATTPPSAKPKVPAPPPPPAPATGLGGLRVPNSVPGHQHRLLSAHPRVRRGMAGLGFGTGVLLCRVFSAPSLVPRGWEHPNPVWGHLGLPGTDLSPPAVTRGDVFALPEDDYLDYDLPIDTGTEPPTRPAAPTGAPTEPPTPLPTVPEDEWGTEEPLLETERPVLELPTTSDGVTDEDETEELCSRKPFNAFTDLKNGSLYAFRGTPRPFSRHVLPSWHPTSHLPPPLSLQGSISTSWTRAACAPATPNSSAMFGASRAPSTQPSRASTARARPTSSRWVPKSPWLSPEHLCPGTPHRFAHPPDPITPPGQPVLALRRWGPGSRVPAQHLGWLRRHPQQHRRRLRPPGAQLPWQ